MTAYKAANAGAAGSTINAPTYEGGCGYYPDNTSHMDTATAVEAALHTALGW